jgi:DnaJ-domain-containing protein 1
MESGSTMQGSGETIPGFEPNPTEEAWRFGNATPQHLREDFQPDPLFFEESWTLGLPAATKNWKRRQQGQADRERQSSKVRDRKFDNIGTQSFLQERAWYSEHFSPAQAAVIAENPDAGGPAEPLVEPAAQTGNQAPREWERFAGECEIHQEATYSMTPRRACRLLGVTATSTGEQIKAAYRRMASQWHPDRLERGTEQVRRMATEQMAAINEAYSLLRSSPRQQAA